MTQTVLLGQIATINMGQSPKSEFYNSVGEGLPFMQGVRTFGRMYPKIDVWCTMPTKVADAGDVLLSVRAPVGDLNFAPERMCIGRGLASLKSRNNKFLYYLIEANKERLISSQTGSVFGSVNATMLKNFRLTVPANSETQDKIADILGTIDEKIELNRKMNETLEQIGQALFRHYFIDNPETEKWENGTADNLFVLTMGLSPKGESYNSDGDGMLLLNGAADFTGASITPKRHTSSPTRVSKPGDVIFCIRGTIGNICIGYQNYCLGRGVAAMTPVKNATSYVYFSTIHAITEMESSAAGSVIRGLSKDDIAKRKVKLPPTIVLDNFEAKVLPLIKEIRINSEEIKTLSNLRDILLPRLISGKIKV